ncbi:rhamnogalacturonyl hydrolase YesR [Chitinophaga skermanii]|uniref:Rhamnogalacturonyl hydrolase YesR n=1 Tax=Chitinophaga skermanii TaxID=331697 RepID=A0A327R5T6_9BACT|nr:glycoside hydrolase family 88 protein [Chitinophaga skermanii]RAJ11054.1 rhamnogalacturonyl hydrolase YesR [Chitinophaga skermanii]
MKRNFYALALAGLLGLNSTKAATVADNDSTLSASSNIQVLKKVADWQILHLERKGFNRSKVDWITTAFYAGLMDFAPYANDNKYHSWLIGIGNELSWNTGPRRYHADDLCIGQTYAQLSNIYDDPKMIAHFKTLADSIIAEPHTASLEWKNDIHMREWAWCDALFMAPTALAYLSNTTKETKYLDIADKLWWKTTDYLYNPKERLYFRDQRYFNQKEANGQPVFWSRGNGWVIAGLARVIDNLPSNYPTRAKYMQLYKDMASRIAELQTSDGTWHAALLDSASYPAKETSGTAFFTYALAWGINNGTLPRDKYLPVVIKGWNALRAAVQENGKLGFVQVVAAAPGHTTAEDTEAYGVGAFMLAGTEMLKLGLKEQKVLNTELHNTLGVVRDGVVEANFSAFASAMKVSSKAPFKVVNALTGEEVAYQIINGQTILFAVKMAPGAKIILKTSPGEPSPVKARTYGRYVPERKDDFAWENDKMAYRMYGKALESTPNEMAYGIDVWCKRTSELVIDKWYKLNNYHHDNGDGMDYYKVGYTLGAGDIAPYINDSLYFPKNYRRFKVLVNGPLRTTFSLEYDAWTAGNTSVTVTKNITLDAGSQLNKFEIVYDMKDGKDMPVAIGIVKRPEPGTILLNEKAGIAGYWEPQHGEDGTTGVGTIVPANVKGMIVDKNHLITKTTATSKKVITYYAGAAWSKAGVYTNSSDWFTYLTGYAKCVQTPVVVTFH